MNEHQEGTNKKVFELTPLTQEQHPVTPIAKFTTELPFFYLTKQKKLLDQDIHYEGMDANGNPIRWDVIPNRSPKIGVPGIEAHTIWTRLVKPSIEMHRTPEGGVPEILPLGGIRKCLRIVGWWEGGYEARRLLQALMQTGQATCDVDFLLPTDKLDDQGRPLFRPVKGIFNRFTIWQIGSRHVSEDEIASGNFKFDFDLDDTLYIQLHKLERDIQRNQHQRYIDNAYMWSIGATERRWYELMAAKIFGVVRNNGSYCEIFYSWYIKHHHTLTRLYTRARVVSQMNRVTRDHLDSGFIAKVEYRATRDEQGQVDFIIRYYLGSEARESVKRVLSFIESSKWPLLVERRVTRKKNLPRSGPRQHRLKLEPIQEAVEAVEPKTTKVAASALETPVNAEFLSALMSCGITASAARELLSTVQPDQQVIDQLEWGKHQVRLNPNIYKNPAGFYIYLIRENVTVPASFETSHKRAVREAEARRRAEEERLQREYELYRSAEIDRYITEHSSEFAALKAIKIKEFTERYGNDSLGMADRITTIDARLEIGKKVTMLSFDELVKAEKALAAAQLSTAQASKDHLDQISEKQSAEPVGKDQPSTSEHHRAEVPPENIASNPDSEPTP